MPRAFNVVAAKDRIHRPVASMLRSTHTTAHIVMIQQTNKQTNNSMIKDIDHVHNRQQIRTPRMKTTAFHASLGGVSYVHGMRWERRI